MKRYHFKSPGLIALTIKAIFFCSIIITNSNCTGTEKIQIAQNEFNETARFLAGKELSKNSRLYKFTQEKFYQNYKKQVIEGWNKFQKPNIKKIQEWWEEYDPNDDHQTVLYPFSGPDVFHAITFFPDANTYIMFGLERPAKSPMPQNLPAYKLKKGLNCIKKALGTIFRYNFFKTKMMEMNLHCRDFEGVTPIIMFFLALHDYNVLDVKQIAINKEGTIAPWEKSDDFIRWYSPKKHRVPGVEISFKNGNGKLQKIRFFSLNIIDRVLRPNSMNFITYLKSEAPFFTVIKSASYLMHNEIKFKTIRDTVLQNSNYIIQDESGVPIRYLVNDTWKMQFHGKYTLPIGLFRNRFQPDLKKAMKNKSTGILPFSYGYNFQKGESHIMTIKRNDYMD